MSTQSEYLSRLEYLLQDMPAERKWELLDDIRQHFDEGIAAGVPEEEISQGLGAPELLAREYLSLYAAEGGEAIAVQPEPSLKSTRRAGKKAPGFWGRLGRFIGLFFLGITLMLPFFITLYALWLALAVSGGAMAVAGVVTALLVMVNRVIPLAFLYVSFPLFTFVAAITITAIGLLLAMAARPTWRWIWRLTVRYFRWNGRVLRGGVR